MSAPTQLPTRTTTGAPAPECQPVWKQGVAVAVVVPTLARRLAPGRLTTAAPEPVVVPGDREQDGVTGGRHG
jgi:hypothetical protein